MADDNSPPINNNEAVTWPDLWNKHRPPIGIIQLELTNMQLAWSGEDGNNILQCPLMSE